MGRPLTVWYDAACPLCRREIALMRRLDWRRQIDFIDLTDPESSCPIDRAVLLARFHIMENGRLHSGAAAFAAMWRATPLLWPLGILAKLPGVLPLLERGYIRFLKIRPKLQRMFRD
jgi:predicted DCC family thiol-disulfide oxidoreductase YuxK